MFLALQNFNTLLIKSEAFDDIVLFFLMSFAKWFSGSAFLSLLRIFSTVSILKLDRKFEGTTYFIHFVYQKIHLHRFSIILPDIVLNKFYRGRILVLPWRLILLP
jgi:hypothetical protein